MSLFNPGEYLQYVRGSFKFDVAYNPSSTFIEFSNETIIQGGNYSFSCFPGSPGVAFARVAIGLNNKDLETWIYFLEGEYWSRIYPDINGYANITFYNGTNHYYIFQGNSADKYVSSNYPSAGTGRRAVAFFMNAVLGKEQSSMNLYLNNIGSENKSLDIYLANKIQPDGVERPFTGRLGDNPSQPSRIVPGRNRNRSNNVGLSLWATTEPSKRAKTDLTVHGKVQKANEMDFVMYGYVDSQRDKKFTGQIGTEDSTPSYISLARERRRASGLSLKMRGDLPGFNSGNDMELYLHNPDKYKSIPLFMRGKTNGSYSQRTIGLFIKGSGGSSNKNTTLVIKSFLNNNNSTNLYLLSDGTTGSVSKNRGTNLFLKSIPVGIFSDQNTSLKLFLSSFLQGGGLTNLFMSGGGSASIKNDTKLFLYSKDWTRYDNGEDNPLTFYIKNSGLINSNTRLYLKGPDKIAINKSANLFSVGGYTKFAPLFLLSHPIAQDGVDLYINSESQELSDYVDFFISGKGPQVFGSTNLFVQTDSKGIINSTATLYLPSYLPNTQRVMPVYLKSTDYLGEETGNTNLFIQRWPANAVDLFLL